MTKFYRNAGVGEGYSLRGSEKPSVIIFTEGPAESYFMEKWLASTQRNPAQIAVLCFKGRQNLSAFFRKLGDDENFVSVSRLGFFLDAESNEASVTVNLLKQILVDAGILPNGYRLIAGHQKVGSYDVAVYVSPNNRDPGMIENMVIEEIAVSQLHPCIEDFRRSVEAIENKLLHPKSIVQSYMAARSDGTCGTGHGFNKHILDVNHAAYADLRTVMMNILES